MGINFVENNKNLTDNAVISLVNDGKYEYLPIILNRYMPLILKTVRQYCHPTQTEDAVQEATIALYSAVKGYDSEKSTFATFAVVCIKRAVMAIVRKSTIKKRIPENLVFPLEESELPVAQSPESILIEKEDYNTLADSIRVELSNMEYSVLQQFLEGKTYCEIANSMSITEKSVANALTRIRKKIKNNG